MRPSLALVVLFFPPAFWAIAEQSEPSRQFDAHQMFLLRDEIRRHPVLPDFYAGQLACAFNDIATCEARFKNVIATDPKSSAAKQARHTLAYALFREGRYARSFNEIEALLKIDSKDADALGTRPFFEALSHFPDQAVQENGTTKATVQMDDGKLPLLINGQKASYFFDTGANLSTLSESEALRLGLEIRDVSSDGGSSDVNGNKVLFRVALAKSLALGDIVLNNVAFLVAGNEQQPFVDMDAGQRGLVGLPVLRAFASIKWSREGLFEIDRSTRQANTGASNLCFDDLLLIVEASFERHELPFVLDTGATTTDLWPKFAEVAKDLIRKSGSHDSHTVTGVGGSQKFEATSIPRVILQLGGKSVMLQPAHVLETQQRVQTRWFYGNLGIDILGQAQEVALDFRTMTIGLAPSDGQRSRPH
jgi:predicted aspartyl protease